MALTVTERARALLAGKSGGAECPQALIADLLAELEQRNHLAAIRQARVRCWIVACFGPGILANVKERVLRVLEETVELCQAEGLTQQEAQRVLEVVYSRPIGPDPRREMAQVRVTLLGYAAAKGYDASDAELQEIDRITEMDPEVFRRRNIEKAAQGIGHVSEPA